MEMYSFLQVAKIENKTTDTGRKFQTVTFRPVKFFGNMQVASQEVRTRNIWGETKLENGDVIKADGFYNNLTVGQLVEGTIETFNTTPYNIGDNEVNTWTGVIFSNEKGINVANKQLKNKNAKVITTEFSVAAAPQVQQAPAVAAPIEFEF